MDIVKTAFGKPTTRAAPCFPEKRLNLLSDVDLSTYFINVKPVKLVFDPERNLFMTTAARRTLADLFGTHDVFRNWYSLRSGLSKVLRYELFNKKVCGGQIYNLPDDAVILAKPNFKSIVVASSANDAVVKIENEAYSANAVESVVNAWERFKSVGMECFVPKLLQSGQTSSGSYFMKLELARNHYHFFSISHKQGWPQILNDVVLPILQQFHEKNGYFVVDGPGWADFLDSKFDSHHISPELKLFWDSLRSELHACPGLRMPIGLLHGDLNPVNVHIYQGQVKFLDWSNSGEASMITDVFYHVFSSILRDPLSNEARIFQAFVFGTLPLASTTPIIRHTATVWVKWLSSWLGIKVSEPILRLQLRAMCWSWLSTVRHTWQSDRSIWNWATKSVSKIAG